MILLFYAETRNKFSTVIEIESLRLGWPRRITTELQQMNRDATKSSVPQSRTTVMALEYQQKLTRLSGYLTNEKNDVALRVISI